MADALGCLHRTPEGPTPLEPRRDWIQGELKRPANWAGIIDII